MSCDWELDLKLDDRRVVPRGCDASADASCRFQES
jgi:hypothetical protein